MYMETLRGDPAAQYTQRRGLLPGNGASAPRRRQHPARGEGLWGCDLLSLIFFTDQFDTRCYKVNFG